MILTNDINDCFDISGFFKENILYTFEAYIPMKMDLFTALQFEIIKFEVKSLHV